MTLSSYLCSALILFSSCLVFDPAVFIAGCLLWSHLCDPALQHCHLCLGDCCPYQAHLEHSVIQRNK